RAVARAHCVQTVALLEAAFGPNHPKLGTAENLLGALDHADQHWADASHHFERAAAIYETNGPRNDNVYALAVSNLRAPPLELGDTARAAHYFEQARDLFARYHPEHPQRV